MLQKLVLLSLLPTKARGTHPNIVLALDALAGICLLLTASLALSRGLIFNQ